MCVLFYLFWAFGAARGRSLVAVNRLLIVEVFSCCRAHLGSFGLGKFLKMKCVCVCVLFYLFWAFGAARGRSLVAVNRLLTVEVSLVAE